jgi:hypothetical protein
MLIDNSIFYMRLRDTYKSEINLKKRKMMSANLYQGQGGFMSVVGEKMKTHLPGPIDSLADTANKVGRFAAFEQGSVGPTMSDMQFMMENERKQHEDAYRYANGHQGSTVPLGDASF